MGTLVLKDLSVQELKDMGLPYDAPEGMVISDRITGMSRWAAIHELIFRLPGQPEGEAWRVTYRHAATEIQDERAWDDMTTVKATLVRQVVRTMTVWESTDGPPEPRAIVGGPVEMRDYDCITLALDHRVEAPDTERTTVLPAGSRLYMVKPSPGFLGLTFDGAAAKAPTPEETQG